MELPTFGLDSSTRHRITSVLVSKTRRAPFDVKEYIDRTLLPATNWFLPDSNKVPSLASAKKVYVDSKYNDELAPFYLADVLRMVVFKLSLGPSNESTRSATQLSGALLQYISARCKMLNNTEGEVCDTEFPLYPKGNGVCCANADGIKVNDFVCEYFGDAYPPWRWSERTELIKKVESQTSMKVDTFFNIALERHTDDPTGYDLVHVDPMYRGNFSSRLSHSCQPNCMTVTMVAQGTYVIGMYAIRDIYYGEELTFDYASVTDSAEESKDAVCLCGSEYCRGTYLFFAGDKCFNQVADKHMNFLQRNVSLLRAGISKLTDVESRRLASLSIGQSMLRGLPQWAVKYLAAVAYFIENESKLLPQELLAKNDSSGYTLEMAEGECFGVKQGRLQSVAVVADQLKHMLRQQQDGCGAPLRQLTHGQIVKRLWSGKDSLVRTLANYLAIHDPDQSVRINAWINKQYPETTDGLRRTRRALKRVRDLLKGLEPTRGAYHHAAADLIHLWASTETFFEATEYRAFRSKEFSMHDLGFTRDPRPKKKPLSVKYGSQYLWARTVYWMEDDVSNIEKTLREDRKGCVLLPWIDSCYSPSRSKKLTRSYEDRQRNALIRQMREDPSKSWPTDAHWRYKNSPMYGSPFVDKYMGSRGGHGLTKIIDDLEDLQDSTYARVEY